MNIKTGVNINNGKLVSREVFLQTIGYIAAHELLHQLLRTDFSGHEGTRENPNLNTAGPKIDFDCYSDDPVYRLKANSIILPQRAYIYQRYDF